MAETNVTLVLVTISLVFEWKCRIGIVTCQVIKTKKQNHHGGPDSDMICTWEDSAALGLGCHSQMLIPTRPLLWLFYSLRKYTGFNLQRKGPQSFEARGLGRVNTRFNHQQKSLYKSLKQVD